MSRLSSNRRTEGEEQQGWGRVQRTEDVSYEDRAKVQIGAELLCKGGKVRGREDYRVRRRGSAKVQIGRRPVQRWKGAGREDYRVRSTEGRPCKGANRPEAGVKVEREEAGKCSECRVRIWEA